MLQSEIMQDFIHNYWNIRAKQMIVNIKKYIQDNYEKIEEDFINSLIKLFKKIIDLQKQDKLGEIKYIDCSFLYTSFCQDRPIYRIFAYDSKTILGDKLCYVEYSLDWLISELIELTNDFIKRKNNYNILLTAAGIDILKRLAIPEVIYWFYCLAKYAVRKAVNTKYFEQIEKTDKLDIYCGEFDNNPYNIYRYKPAKGDFYKTFKDIKNVHYGKSLFGVFNEAKIINMDLSDIDFRFSRFNKCSFLNCYFGNNILDDVEFVQCQISNSVFNNSRLYGISFIKTIIQDVQFNNINTGENFIEKDLNQLVFKDILFEQCVIKSASFKNSNFNSAKFQKSGVEQVVLSNSDFVGSNIKKIPDADLNIQNTLV